MRSGVSTTPSSTLSSPDRLRRSRLSAYAEPYSEPVPPIPLEATLDLIGGLQVAKALQKFQTIQVIGLTWPEQMRWLWSLLKSMVTS